MNGDGSGSGPHPDLCPELRALAQSILDRIDPAVRSAAAMVAARGGGAGQGKCQQVWCPVCALAAVATGEQHPLLTVIAEHNVALLAVVRMIVDGLQNDSTNNPAADQRHSDRGPTDDRPDEPPPDGGGSVEPPKTRYQHIPVTVEE